jgi:hypothetical protein
VQVVGVDAEPVSDAPRLHYSNSPSLQCPASPSLRRLRIIAANKTGEAKPSEVVEMLMA